MATSDPPPPKPDVASLPAETIDFAHKMFEAARTGNSELLLAAIDAGLPLNLTNDKGNTLLMLAAYAGQAELTKQLLDRGADPNRLNDLGQSMIAGAVFKAHTDVVKALAEKGADPRIGTPNAIQAAIMFNRKDLMNVLGVTEDDVNSANVPIPPSAATKRDSE
ncbi:ankyrin repeat-containing domain protein [Crucibulum laeve]|uniref:Ankyrin repeat-containing domain protein n=1 Tax=Crucibulum laeve TaxID=68775 RepID=A0A5C3MDV6_9AGAR|nr:ankyrin repeat-containing domain protein [Crucibulum laeve]